MLLRLDMQAGHGMGSTANQRNNGGGHLQLLAVANGQGGTKARATQADIIQQSQPSDWRALDPDNTVVMEIQGQTVVMELARALPPARGQHQDTDPQGLLHRFCRGARSRQPRCQWADPADDDKPESKTSKALGSAWTNCRPEFTIAYQGLPISRLPTRMAGHP